MNTIFTSRLARRERYHLAGDILSANSESLREHLTRWLAHLGEAPLGTVELHLSDARMVDSVGLNLLIWLLKQLRARGGKLCLMTSDPNLLRIFQFTRLDRYADVVQTPA